MKTLKFSLLLAILFVAMVSDPFSKNCRAAPSTVSPAAESSSVFVSFAPGLSMGGGGGIPFGLGFGLSARADYRLLSHFATGIYFSYGALGGLSFPPLYFGASKITIMADFTFLGSESGPGFSASLRAGYGLASMLGLSLGGGFAFGAGLGYDFALSKAFSLGIEANGNFSLVSGTLLYNPMVLGALKIWI